MKLIENPRAVFKHYSLIALSTIASATTAYLAMPEKYQALVPYGDKAVLVGMLIAAVLGTGGKFVQQSPPKDVT